MNELCSFMVCNSDSLVETETRGSTAVEPACLHLEQHPNMNVLLDVRTARDDLVIQALPFLEAKAKEVEDRDDLLYSAHQLVVHQCQSVLNLITTPSVDDDPPMPAPMVKPRAKKSATSIASATAGPGHDFMHLSVDELGRSLSGA